MSGLVITDLYAAYGQTTVLTGIELSLHPEQLLCVLGPSGCGKSTLLRSIAGFHRPSRGRIELNGRVLDAPGVHVPAEKRRVGYIPQDVALFPHLSVRDNISFGLPRAQRAKRAAELLELVDLGEYAKRKPSELSGGQQQRVALARALAHDPEMLLLDEPFSALDMSLRTRVRNDVIDLLRRTRTTAVLVTHDATEALAFADIIAIVSDGKILQVGAPEELHARPSSAEVAFALGDANVLLGVAVGGRARTALGSLSVAEPLASASSSVLVRPDQLRIEVGPGDGEPREGAIEAEVIRSDFRGSDYRIELSIAGHPEPLIAHTGEGHKPGSVVQVSVVGPVCPLRDDAQS